MAAAVRKAERALTVLVVEDEDEVCGLISDILEGAGFDSHCVSNDRAAYTALAAVQRYSAVLVDVNLGEGTTGFDVARFARQMNPRLPVIYVSGAASSGSFKAFGVPDSRFLQKPFTADELVATLMALVDPAAD
jgi:CheY-like chemotaxis protein